MLAHGHSRDGSLLVNLAKNAAIFAIKFSKFNFQKMKLEIKPLVISERYYTYNKDLK